MLKRALLQPQFLLFVAGGLLCALIDIGLMQLLIGGGAAPVAAASAGFVAGLVVNYAFHAKVTFKQLSSSTTVARYLCVVAANYLITVALVALAQSLLGWALAGKLASLPLVAVNGYLLSKYWVFK
ncbi:GtrA family protein [Duganella sp. S19_KUP01_CR8]|uniref:GtrA family protein n=1 Tax=Duganella sp. S19_KUP01_CR8 TaxID=3025502 RepID=UPI002FCDB2C7